MCTIQAIILRGVCTPIHNDALSSPQLRSRLIWCMGLFDSSQLVFMRLGQLCDNLQERQTAVSCATQIQVHALVARIEERDSRGEKMREEDKLIHDLEQKCCGEQNSMGHKIMLNRDETIRTSEVAEKKQQSTT